MIKAFYKKQQKRKTFFDRNVTFRSFAYGTEILDEYLSWLRFYSECRKNREKHFWLSKQGDASNNAVFGCKEDRCSTDVKTIISRSVLTPLFYEDMLFEVDEKGYLLINGERSGFIIMEPKAWALTVLPRYGGVDVKLAILAKSENQYKLHLTLFDVTDDGIKKSDVAPTEMETTLENESYLICFGRHFFAVHNGTLHYFYLNENRKELERVAVMDDKSPTDVECLGRVLPCIVAGDDGTIYWCSADTIYSFVVGFPKNVTTVGTPFDGRVVRLQYACGGVFAYTKTADGDFDCTVFAKSDDGYSERRFCSAQKRNMVFGKSGGNFRFAAIGERATYFDGNGRTSEIPFFTRSQGKDGEAFYLYGAVACGIRSAVYDNGKFVLVE